MAKFQLTISSAYVSDWSVYEGIREIIQNTLDGRDAGFPMSITYRDGHLIASNAGVQLDRSVWLMGLTTKESGDFRGHFGEGMKLGALALVRAGRKLRIINNTEDWNCSLQESTAFPGQQVLTVSTRTRPTPAGRFEVHIECEPHEWEQYQNCFIELKPELSAIKTSDTHILTDESERGRVYVKGILVETMDDLYAGYNFLSGVRTDRDRRTVNSFDLGWHSSHAWLQALQDEDITAGDFLDTLSSDTRDGKGIGDRYCSEPYLSAIATEWFNRHGEFSIPVPDAAAAKEAGHFGKIGIICGQQVCNFFREHPELGLEKIRTQRRAEVARTYNTSELDQGELDNLELAIELVDSVAPGLGIIQTTGRLFVVDFNNDDILGTHSYVDERAEPIIRLARKTLTTFDECIRVLVHEAAHDRGGDGDVAHERAEGQLFSRIISDLALARPAIERIKAKRRLVAA